MADRWNRKVMILRRTKLKEPKLAEFISFIEQETVLINDPLYSRSAIIQVNPKATSKASQEKRRWNAKALATKVDTPCPICNSLHDIENYLHLHHEACRRAKSDHSREQIVLRLFATYDYRPQLEIVQATTHMQDL